MKRFSLQHRCPGNSGQVTTAAEPSALIEYRITQGSPLRGHWGRQVLTPTATGGTHLDYTIGFDLPVPGVAAVLGKAMQPRIAKGLRGLVS